MTDEAILQGLYDSAFNSTSAFFLTAASVSD